MSSSDLAIILPEIFLALYAMVALLAAVWTGKDNVAPLITWISAAVLLATAIWVMLSSRSCPRTCSSPSPWTRTIGKSF